MPRRATRGCAWPWPGRRAMQSGMPMAPNPLPAPKRPGMRLEALRRWPAPACRCPTTYCGLCRVQRATRVSTGAPGDAEHVPQLLRRQICQPLVVVLVEALGVAAAAEEGAQQHVPGRRAARPLRRDPCGGQQRPAFGPRDHEARAPHRVRDLFRAIAEGHRGGGRIVHAVAQRRQRLVEGAKQRGGLVGRHRQQHRARANVPAAGAPRRSRRRRAARSSHGSPAPPCPAAARATSASTSSPTPPGSDTNAPSSRGCRLQSRGRPAAGCHADAPHPPDAETAGGPTADRRRRRGCRRAAARPGSPRPRGRTGGPRTPAIDSSSSVVPASRARDQRFGRHPRLAQRREERRHRQRRAATRESRGTSPRAADAAGRRAARRPCAARASTISCGSRPSSRQSAMAAGFCDQERVGPAIHDPAVEAFGLHHAAGRRPASSTRTVRPRRCRS